MKIQNLNPLKITVREGLARYRQDMGSLKLLAASIQKYGQLQPIVVTQNFELIAGGRRLAACLMFNLEVTCVFKGDLSDIELRVIEVEENIQRKAFSPAEEIEAIESIHALKSAEFKEAHKGKFTDKVWGFTETATLLGVSPTSIQNKVSLAEVVKAHPELKKVKTLKDIKKAAEAIKLVEKKVMAAKAFNRVKTSITNSRAEVTQANAFEHMKTIEEASIDVLLTDPPYGIEIDKIAQSIGGATGEFNTTGYTFDDNQENALRLYKALAIESFRFTKNTAHAYVFLAPEFFTVVTGMFREAGWNVYVRPIIWIKTSSGQNNVPKYWPSACYEMCIYARRSEANLVKQGQPDWIDTPPVKFKDKTHPTEKPVTLLKALIERSCLAGQTLYDPFMGSGATLIAGLEKDLIVKGCDILTMSFSTAKLRVDQWFKVNE